MTFSAYMYMHLITIQFIFTSISDIKSGGKFPQLITFILRPAEICPEHCLQIHQTKFTQNTMHNLLSGRRTIVIGRCKS